MSGAARCGGAAHGGESMRAGGRLPAWEGLAALCALSALAVVRADFVTQVEMYDASESEKGHEPKLASIDYSDPADQMAMAAAAFDTEQVELLIREGYDVNSYDKYNMTALGYVMLPLGSHLVEDRMKVGGPRWLPRPPPPSHSLPPACLPAGGRPPPPLALTWIPDRGRAAEGRGGPGPDLRLPPPEAHPREAGANQ